MVGLQNLFDLLRRWHRTDRAFAGGDQVGGRIGKVQHPGQVSLGQAVAQGDVLGYVGSTGNSTGNHLHLELRVNDARTNALNYVPH